MTGPAVGTVGGLTIDPQTSDAEADRLARVEAERDAAREALHGLLSAVSHELRTPLNAVLGWAALLATGKLPPETAREGVAVIERNTQAQVRLLNRAADAARVLAGKVVLDLAPVDLARVVAAAAGGSAVVRTVGPGRPVRGDAVRLEQVVGELLANAVRHTAAGGRVAVRVEYPPGGGAVITVADTGDGIAPDLLPHLFDPTPRRPGRLGVGLAVVRRLVELHGGTVRAASDGPGRGAAFTVTLPAAGAD